MSTPGLGDMLPKVIVFCFFFKSPARRQNLTHGFYSRPHRDRSDVKPGCSPGIVRRPAFLFNSDESLRPRGRTDGRTDHLPTIARPHSTACVLQLLELEELHQQAWVLVHNLTPRPPHGEKLCQTPLLEKLQEHQRLKDGGRGKETGRRRTTAGQRVAETTWGQEGWVGGVDVEPRRAHEPGTFRGT